MWGCRQYYCDIKGWVETCDYVPEESCPHRQNSTRVQTPSYSIAKLRVREIAEKEMMTLKATRIFTKLLSPSSHLISVRPAASLLTRQASNHFFSLSVSLNPYLYRSCISVWFQLDLIVNFYYYSERVLYVAIIHTFILLRDFISSFVIKGFWISDEHGSWECCYSPQEFGFVTYPRPYCWQMGWCTWQKDYQGLSKLTIFIFSFWVEYGSSTN